MLFSIAYRNIWRNPLRTWILILSIAVGMFAGIFSIAFSTGMLKKKTDNSIINELSHLQTHMHKFTDINDINMHFPNAYEKCIEIGSIEGVRSTTYRIIINGIISSEKATQGIKIAGIVPDIEKTTTDVHKKIIEGKYLECHEENGIIVSQDLAKKLLIGLNSKISIRFQNTEGFVKNNIFIVCGIFRTGNIKFDNRHVFVKYSDLSREAALPRNSAHEIGILLNNEKDIDRIQSKINELFPYMETQSWKEIAPVLNMMNQSSFWSTYLLNIIILIGLSFGITNSMCMVILDRISELGMLMAVGMNRFRIFLMLMLESIKITLLGGFIGIFLGMVAIEITGMTGIHLSFYEQEIRELGYDYIVHPFIYNEQLFWVIILVSITAFLSSIYPAVRAMRYRPTDSIKSE